MAMAIWLIFFLCSFGYWRKVLVRQFPNGTVHCAIWRRYSATQEENHIHFWAAKRQHCTLWNLTCEYLIQMNWSMSYVVTVGKQNLLRVLQTFAIIRNTHWLILSVCVCANLFCKCLPLDWNKTKRNAICNQNFPWKRLQIAKLSNVKFFLFFHTWIDHCDKRVGF